MASAIFFNGRRIVVPQAASRIDASALQASSPASAGIVALIGTAEGGVPLTCDEQYDLNKPDAARDQYRSGDLKVGSLFCFEPSQDQAIPGGAQKIVPIKVNPATQSTAQLADANSDPSVDLTSVGYGQFTEQINIDVGPGTTLGKMISINFEGITETFDDVGGEALFEVEYTPGTEGYTTALGRITSAGFLVDVTKAESGLVAERTADIAAPGTLEYLSSSASDTTQLITVYGLSGTTPVRESITLNGTTVVAGTQSFSKVLGVVKSDPTQGTVTVRSTVPTTLFSLSPVVQARGVVLTTNTPVADGVLTVAIDTNAAVDVAVWGRSPAGAVVAERFDMTAGAGGVTGTVAMRSIEVIALGDVAGARTVTTSCRAVSASNGTFRTIQRLVDRLNQLDGFSATGLASDVSSFLLADADYAPAVSLVGSAAEFYADLYRFIEVVNERSQYMRAARATNGALVPDDTASPVYLTGGGEGTTTITQWQEAFRLLRKRRVNVIVPLTRDPAVHSLLLSHLIERAGALRSEANGYVGIATSDGEGETLSNFRQQIQQLNTRHISAMSQEVQRFDPDTGEATWYPPYFLAAIAAGMQAGSSVGEPLTRKIINALDIRNDSSWEVEDDIDLLIDSGAMVAEKVDGVGIRWVRSITTHLQDDNLVFTEMSMNESANRAVFRLREAVELKIGSKGLARTVGVIKGLAADELDRMVADEEIAAWRPETLVVQQVGDVFPLDVEIAPVGPVNFIPITAHLVPLRATA